MKIKSIFTLICSIILTLCLYSVAFAANAKTEAVSFLQQATKNTVEAQNAAYSINLSMTGPLADCSIDLNGSYAYPILTSGDMSLALDLWIIDTTFEAQTQYYSELEGNVYKQYFKTQADPKGAAANVSPKINSDQWYVQSVSLPENFVADYAERTQKSINDVADDVKNIFMYDVDDKTAKVYVTYKKPILDEEKLNEALNLTNLNEKEMAQVAAVSQKLEENPKLKAALLKPRELTYEITVDRENMVITSLKSDLSPLVQQFGSEVLSSISDKELSITDTPDNGATVRNIIKNYLERSKFTMDINLSNFNKATVQPVPQEVKDSAVEPPKPVEKIGEADEETNLTVAENVLEAVANE